MKLLREFIKNTLNERIRSNNFDLNEFKRLKTIAECNEYAKKHLQYINSGSTRNSYVLSSKKVLKIAKTLNSVDQNVREVKTSKTQQFNEFFTKVFDHHPEYFWIISELVKPIDDFKKVCKFFGLKCSSLVDIVLYVSKQYKINQRYGKNSPILPPLSNIENYDRANTFVSLMINAVQNDIDINDIIGVDQWGYAPDGRIVLLDYGA